MKTFLVSEECRDLGLRAGAVVIRDVQISAATAELRAQIDEEVQRIRSEFATPAEIRSLPELVKMHEILRKAGVKPRNHPPSTQKLLEFVLKRGMLPAVNNLVDAYNLVSVRTRCSLGAHDLDRISVPVKLRLLRGDERFRPLGGNRLKGEGRRLSAAQPVNRGEFGYVDADDRVICRLDSLQAEFSKITPTTTRALLIIEASTAVNREQLEKIFSETAERIGRYCHGQVESVVLPD